MSGIAGILRLDGAPARSPDLERMANALSRHGPDRRGVAVSGQAGFVHTLMRVTPEDYFDHQPLKGASGSIITADLRIDNRDDVADKIGLSKNELSVWSDSRLLLAAWERLGDGVWPILRGVFAAAIWDPRRRILTIARDHLGLNVVMYHRSPSFFAFATMPRGLFALADVNRELDEEKLADFMVLNHADHVTTIYKGIFRVPPAHVMTIQADGTAAQRCYWTIGSAPGIVLSSDQDYAEAMRERLDRAVRRQLRSCHPVGCYLSGGLDSSSVTALAARAFAEKGQRLAAYTQVPREGFSGPVPVNRYADEMPYVEEIRKSLGNVDVTYIRNNDCDDFAELEKFFDALEFPVRNPTNLGWMMAILRTARAQGRRVLLSGETGNSTISWSGWSLTAAHLKQGHLLRAFLQWRQYYRNSPFSRWTAFRKLLLEPLLPDRIGERLDRMRNPGRVAPWQRHSVINLNFAADMKVGKRARQVGHDFLYRTRTDSRPRSLTAHDYIGDWNAAEKATLGVDTRDPTADVDVVEFCFGVPQEQYLKEDIDRSLIRRAMWGILPRKVLRNRLSGLQAADWYEKLEASRDKIAADIAQFRGSALASRMLDLDRMDRAVRNWPTEGWDHSTTVSEYDSGLARGIATGKFLKWIEQSNS